jgi:hypothetical protein
MQPASVLHDSALESNRHGKEERIELGKVESLAYQ